MGNVRDALGNVGARSAAADLRVAANHWVRRRRGHFLLGMMAALVVHVHRAEAADRSADFLAALQKAGWNDTAVEFLDWAEKSPLASDAFRSQIPYQRAVSLTTQGRQSRNRGERKRLLARAALDFQKFAESDPAGPLAADALRRAANLYAEQALATLVEADRLPEAAASQREAARRDARQSFQLAQGVAEQLLEACNKQLASLPKPSALDATDDAAKQRDALRTKQVEARFLLGLISFEGSRTFERDSAEFKTALARAAEQFGSLHEQFREAVVGASSRFYQGRCFQEQGEYQKALGCYKDLTSLPAETPEFRSWTARAYRHTAECLLAQGNLEEAVRSSKRWLAVSRPAERQQPEWLEVTYRLAEAYQRQLDEAPEGAKTKNLQAESRSLLEDVAANPNEFQRDARMALATLGRKARKVGELKTFDDAFAAGKEAFELMTSAESAEKLARQNNPDAVAELQQQAKDNKAAAQARWSWRWNWPTAKRRPSSSMLPDTSSAGCIGKTVASTRRRCWASFWPSAIRTASTRPAPPR